MVYFLLWVVLVKEDYVKPESFLFVSKGTLRPEFLNVFPGFIKLMYHVHI